MIDTITPQPIEPLKEPSAVEIFTARAIGAGKIQIAIGTVVATTAQIFPQYAPAIAAVGSALIVLAQLIPLPRR